MGCIVGRGERERARVEAWGGRPPVVYDPRQVPRVGELLERLAGEAQASQDQVTGWWPFDRAPASAVELAAAALRDVAARPEDGVIGVEWWLRVAPVREGHGWHWDRDEEAEGDRRAATPVRASVLYLGHRGGPTVIIDLTRDVGRVARLRSLEVVSVNPAPGRFVTFPGESLHGVAAVEGYGFRRTLLLNWWRERPAGVAGA